MNNQQHNSSHNSNIQETYTLTPIIDTLKNIHHDDNTLVIFDVDDVLIIPRSEDDFRDPARSQLLENIIKHLNADTSEKIYSIILKHRTSILIDPMISEMFKILYAKKIPTLALTGMGTGKFGIIENMEEFRYHELKKLGIEFDVLSPLKGKCAATQLDLGKIKLIPNAIKIQGLPSLNFGIIFSSGLDKGPILEFMFNQYNYFPKNIVFVDDLMSNVESIEKMANLLKINFQGFWFKAGSNITLPTINKKLEKIRFEILEKEHKWLSYDELSNFMV